MLVLRRTEGQWVEIVHAASGAVLRVRVYAILTEPDPAGTVSPGVRRRRPQLRDPAARTGREDATGDRRMSGLAAPFPYFGGKSASRPSSGSGWATCRTTWSPSRGRGRLLPADPDSRASRRSTTRTAWSRISGVPFSSTRRPSPTTPTSRSTKTTCTRGTLGLWASRTRHPAAGRRPRVVRRQDRRLVGLGLCCWIGSGWCSGKGHGGSSRPRTAPASCAHLGDAGRG